MTYHILVERMTVYGKDKVCLLYTSPSPRVYGKDKVIVHFRNGMEIEA